MIGILEAILAVVGLGLLILLAIGALRDKAPSPPLAEGAAAPYRQGLHTAIRMQWVAQDLERQIYAEAARHMDADAEGSDAQMGQP